MVIQQEDVGMEAPAIRRSLLSVPVNMVAFWVQIYNLPFGFMSNSIGRQLGNSMGKFLCCDTRCFLGRWQDFPMFG